MLRSVACKALQVSIGLVSTLLVYTPYNTRYIKPLSNITYLFIVLLTSFAVENISKFHSLRPILSIGEKPFVLFSLSSFSRFPSLPLLL